MSTGIKDSSRSNSADQRCRVAPPPPPPDRHRAGRVARPRGLTPQELALVSAQRPSRPRRANRPRATLACGRQACRRGVNTRAPHCCVHFAPRWGGIGQALAHGRWTPLSTHSSGNSGGDGQSARGRGSRREDEVAFESRGGGFIPCDIKMKEGAVSRDRQRKSALAPTSNV